MYSGKRTRSPSTGIGFGCKMLRTPYALAELVFELVDRLGAVALRGLHLNRGNAHPTS